MANQAKITTQNMAHLAHSIHFLIQLVILVVGRSCYRENPHPELSRYKDVDRKHKNTTYDQAFENVYLIRKFLVKHRVTSDDMCMLILRQIDNMTSPPKTMRPRPTESVIEAVRSSLASEKASRLEITMKQTTTVDDSGLTEKMYAKNNQLAECQKCLDDSPKPCNAFRGSEAHCAADPQETDIPHIRTDISLYDSFSEVMENIESKVLSNSQLDQTMSELDIKSEPGVDKPLILGTAHTVTIDNITPVKPGIDSPVLAGNVPLPEPKHGKDKRKRCNNSNSSISDTSSGSPGLVKQTKKKSKVKTDKWIPNMITLKRRGITALTVMADKASKQFTRQMKKLSNQQLEATPNKTKPLSKRDLSPGTPDSETASPEPKKLDFNTSPEHKKLDFDSFVSTNDSYYNIDSSSSSTGKSETERTHENPAKTNKIIPMGDGARASAVADVLYPLVGESPTTPDKTTSNGDKTPAIAEALSPLPDIKPVKPLTASTPIIPDNAKIEILTRPNFPDIVSETPALATQSEPVITITSEDQTRPKITDTVPESPTQPDSEHEVMEVIDLVNDSKTRPRSKDTVSYHENNDPGKDNIAQAKSKADLDTNWPDTREHSLSQPQNASMTNVTDNNRGKSESDDVAVTDSLTTSGPSKTMTNPISKTNGKPSGKTHKPSRAETDKHWRSNLNREQTRQVYIDSAKAGNHAPGKGPSCSDNISLSQMTSEQKLARTLAISEVDTGKGRAKAPDTSDSDLDTSGNNTGNTADKATPQNNQANKSTKTAKTKTQHKHKAFFVPPAKYVNGQKANEFIKAIRTHTPWFQSNPNAIALKTISNGRQIIIPGNDLAENALKAPVKYTAEDSINLNHIGQDKQAAIKSQIPGLSWQYTPSDFTNDKRITKCSVLKAADGKSWTAILHSTEKIDSIVARNKHFRPSDMTSAPKRCTKCQRFGHQKFQCKAKANICAFCAEQHTSDQCFQAIKAGKTVVRKCANCQGNHQATSKNCIKFLIANGQAPSTPPVVNPWQNRPKPDAATNAAQSQPARHARPTPSIFEPRAPYLNGRQRCQMALVAYRINQSLTKHHRNRICPNDIARQIFYGKTRYPPQPRSHNDRHYVRDWQHIAYVIDAARWDLGDLVYAMEPESFGAKIRDMKYP